MDCGGGKRLALGLVLANAGLVIGGLTLLVLTLDRPPEGGWGFRGFPAIFAVAAGAVGWLIMVRRPENRIGLVLAIVGVLNGAQLFMTEYAWAGTRSPLPVSNFVAWVNAFIWVPTLALMAGVVPLLFPDGRLPSPRWRPAAAAMAVGSLMLMAIIAIYPDALETNRIVRPLIQLHLPAEILNTASYLALSVLSVGIVLSVASLILRWRRATGVVREQLKWLALSGTMVTATMGMSLSTFALAQTVFIFAIGTVPIAVGIAVLRYRLYEIDAVISRTFVFGALTAILTGTFAALQKVLQSVFVSVTGNESDAATIITTLILATSFVPLKKALEKLAERRFGDHIAAADLTGEAPARRGTEGPIGGGDLETLLRRVVREEVRAAFVDGPGATLKG